jgi:hypothetical protein
VAALQIAGGRRRWLGRERGGQRSHLGLTEVRPAVRQRINGVGLDDEKSFGG